MVDLENFSDGIDDLHGDKMDSIHKYILSHTSQ